MNSTISEKGQVTIPKALRERLGIRPGDILEFTEEDGRIVVRKARHRDPIERIYGLITCGSSTDELIDELRGPVDG